MTNVLLIYEAMIPSVRLCAYEQLQYLHDMHKICLVHTEVKKLTESMCVNADVVVFVRGASILEEKLAVRFKKKGKFLIYALDDDILNIPDNLASSPYYQSRAIKNRIIKIIANSNVMITPSKYLADKYSEFISRVILIEEPSMLNKLHKDVNDRIKIGFAGSIDRSNDIDEIISGALYEINKKYGNQISIEFMGAKPQIVNELNCTHYPYTDDYLLYKEALNNLNWDIGLAPLPDTKFHNGKHYIKYIEYSSAQIVGLYSNVQPYNQVIINKVNGLLCENNTESWVHALSFLIENEDFMVEIRKYNSKIVEKQFGISFIAEQLFQDIHELSTYKARKVKGFALRYIKYYSFLVRSYEFIKRNGVKSPILMMQKIKTYRNGREK